MNPKKLTVLFMLLLFVMGSAGISYADDFAPQQQWIIYVFFKAPSPGTHSFEKAFGFIQKYVHIIPGIKHNPAKPFIALLNSSAFPGKAGEFCRQIMLFKSVEYADAIKCHLEEQRISRKTTLAYPQNSAAPKWRLSTAGQNKGPFSYFDLPDMVIPNPKSPPNKNKFFLDLLEIAPIKQPSKLILTAPIKDTILKFEAIILEFKQQNQPSGQEQVLALLAKYQQFRIHRSDLKGRPFVIVLMPGKFSAGPKKLCRLLTKFECVNKAETL